MTTMTASGATQTLASSTLKAMKEKRRQMKDEPASEFYEHWSSDIRQTQKSDVARVGLPAAG